MNILETLMIAVLVITPIVFLIKFRKDNNKKDK